PRLHQSRRWWCLRAGDEYAKRARPGANQLRDPVLRWLPRVRYARQQRRPDPRDRLLWSHRVGGCRWQQLSTCVVRLVRNRARRARIHPPRQSEDLAPAAVARAAQDPEGRERDSLLRAVMARRTAVPPRLPFLPLPRQQRTAARERTATDGVLHDGGTRNRSLRVG